MKDYTEDLMGQQFGNYRLTRLIGQGGFADVYLGKHIYLNTQAAIKFLRIQLTKENINSFRAEAQTVAHLDHPHITRVLDFDVQRGIPFLVMDYAPNGTLRMRHPRGIPLPLATIIPYVKQIASALQYVHMQQLIHHDVKPENMLLGENHEVLLCDFGIALVTQHSRNISTKDVVGTVTYMAPEQLRGKLSSASDQYALGIAVYEWLSGAPPFQGSFVELCAQHLTALPPPLTTKGLSISPHIEETVFRALAKDPQLRFHSTEAFALALEQASEPTYRRLTPTIAVPQPKEQTSISQSPLRFRVKG